MVLCIQDVQAIMVEDLCLRCVEQSHLNVHRMLSKNELDMRSGHKFVNHLSMLCSDLPEL